MFRTKSTLVLAGALVLGLFAYRGGLHHTTVEKIHVHSVKAGCFTDGDCGPNGDCVNGDLDSEGECK